MPQTGQPANLLAGVDAGLAGPPILDNDTFAHLSTFAEEDSVSQALTLAAQQSQTDMLKAVPTQNVTLDTRSTRWVLTSARDDISDVGSITANLASAQVVKLNTTRVRGMIRLHLDAAVPAGDYAYYPPTAFPLQGFTMGLKVGSNGTSIQDIGTQDDQIVLTSMEYYSRDAAGSRIKCVNSSQDNDMLNGATAAHSFFITKSDGLPFTEDFEFEFRPTCALFACEKAWPPSIPLKLQINWTPQTLAKLLQSPTNDQGVPTSPAPAMGIKIYDIISDEITLNPALTAHLQMQFLSAPTTNMDLMLKSMRNGAPANKYFDETFGIGDQLDMNKIAAIYQFPIPRLTTFNISGSSCDVYAVMNGNPRPNKIVIASSIKIPGSAPGPNSFATPSLKTLQILYDGRTVYDQPLTTFQMYTETLKAVGGGYLSASRPISLRDYRGATITPQAYGYINTSYSTYSGWAGYTGTPSTNAYIVLKVGPSHNDEDIQPARATQLEIRATYDPIDINLNPGGTALLRVGLFYDQTMLVMKNNTVIPALPIQ